MQPVLAGEFDALDERLRPRAGIHGAAILVGIDEGFHADLGEHAGALGGPLAQHVEDDAGGHVPGGKLLVEDHLPDEWRLGIAGAGGIGAADDLRQHARLGDVIDALGAKKVAGGDRMDGGEAARMSLAVEALAQRLQHGIGAAETRGRIDGDDRAIPDEFCRLLRALHFPHRRNLRSPLH